MPPTVVAPTPHVSTHTPAEQIPLAHVAPTAHCPPVDVKHSPPTACLPGGHTQLLLSGAHELPVGDEHSQLVEPASGA